MLLVALDANFKLKNRMRPNERPDPSLGPGWGYFVEPEQYQKHLKSYVAEKDVRMSSSSSSHQLMVVICRSVHVLLLRRFSRRTPAGRQGYARLALVVVSVHGTNAYWAMGSGTCRRGKGIFD